MSSELSNEQTASILIVDDESVMRDLLVRWLTSHGYRCLQAAGASQAWDVLKAEPVRLITMDVNMPGESGMSLLQRVKAEFPDIPVVMLTASGATGTAIEALTAGALSYLIKPIQQQELTVQVERGLEWRQLMLERRDYTTGLEQKVREQTRVIRQAHEETIHRLVAATMCRDEETGAHIVRTGLYSEVLARAAGWSQAEAERIGLAAPMHDIGKIGIPDAILQKPGRLTPDEFEVMKGHTTIGAEVLACSLSPVLQLAREIALNHHERWDGKGYPNGIAGEAIPESARILTIVDVYDALTHDRVYRPTMSQAEAFSTMQSQQGTQFDSMLLTTFFTILDEINEISRQNPDSELGIAVRSPVLQLGALATLQRSLVSS